MVRLSAVKPRALRLIANLRGWKTGRKLLVIESDDWGALRMPSTEAYERLQAAGISVDRSRYDKLDCLENRDDFQALMNIIERNRDETGRPAIFTFNTVMGNPDFQAIEATEFSQFHHQDLFESYRQYHGEDLTNDWCQAMSEQLIRPQYHGCEHLNVSLWMSDLRSGYIETKTAFDNNFYGLTTVTSSPRQNNYLAAFWAESESQLKYAKQRLELGMSLFKDAFGFRSSTFIPCNFILPAELEYVLDSHGVNLIQGQRGQFVPEPMGGAGYIRRAYTGKRSLFGPQYSVRNVVFEPFESSKIDWVAKALWEIGESFLFRRPAIVSTHRVNYVSGMSRPHRNRSLQLLDRLLGSIRKRWPDVEFITSDELVALMKSS